MKAAQARRRRRRPFRALVLLLFFVFPLLATAVGVTPLDGFAPLARRHVPTTAIGSRRDPKKNQMTIC